MNEIWKNISGYEGYYQISSLGEVRGLERKVKSSRSTSGYRTVKSKIIKARIDKYGYKTVILRKNNKDQHFTIHRLVATHFIENPSNLPSINHKDENKLNNIYTNLEWCTVGYNNLYNDRQNKIVSILRSKDFGNPKVVQINLLTGESKVYKSLHEASTKTGFSRQEISKCCRKIRTSYHDCKWEFISSTTIP